MFSLKKGILGNFEGEGLCHSLFSNTVASLQSATLSKTKLRDFCEILNNTFLIEHLWAIPSKCNVIFNSFKQSKSMNRFLYDRGLSHEKLKKLFCIIFGKSLEVTQSFNKILENI